MLESMSEPTRERWFFKREGDRLNVLLVQSANHVRFFEVTLRQPGIEMSMRAIADSERLKTWLRGLSPRG